MRAFCLLAACLAACGRGRVDDPAARRDADAPDAATADAGTPDAALPDAAPPPAALPAGFDVRLTFRGLWWSPTLATGARVVRTARGVRLELDPPPEGDLPPVELQGADDALTVVPDDEPWRLSVACFFWFPEMQVRGGWLRLTDGDADGVVEDLRGALDVDAIVYYEDVGEEFDGPVELETLPADEPPDAGCR